MQKQSLTHQTVSGMFWQGAVAGINLVVRALVIIILARHLSARDFGIVAAGLVVAAIAQVFAQIGVTKAIVQRLTIDDRHVRSGFAVSLYTAIASAMVVFFGAPLFAAAFDIDGVEPVVRLFSVLLLLNGIAAVPLALLLRARRFRVTSAIELFSFCTGYGAIGLLLTFAGFGYWALAYAHVSQVLIRSILYMLAARPPIGFWPEREPVRDLYAVGSGYSAGQIGNLVATQVDYFIVGRLLGAEQLGLYNRAYQLLMLPVNLLGSASQAVLFPSIASIQDQPERVARAYLRAIGVIAMVTLPMSGVLMVLAPELVDVALGPRWHGMVVPFQILIATLIFRTSYKISDSLSLAIGSMYQRAWRQWVYAGAVAAGALIGTYWGLAGVAAGVGAAVALNFLLMLQLSLRLTGIPAGRVLAVHVRHALAALPIVASTAVVVAFARTRGFSELEVFGIGSLVSAAVAALIWWRCRWIFGEDGAWAHSLALSRLPVRRAGAGS